MLFRRAFRNEKTSPEIDDAVLTMSKPEAAWIEWTLDHRPVWYFFLLIVGIFVVLTGRLVYLNLWRGEYYGELARNNSLRSILLAAPRGIISDRFGVPLVKNAPSLDGIVIPAQLPENESERQRILDTVARIFHPDTSAWREVLESRVFRPNEAIMVRQDLSQEDAIIYYSQANALPGIGIQKSARREYINGSIFSSVIGYEGKIRKEELEEYPEYLLTDSIGKQGVEKTYESELRGTHGREVVEVDSLGRVKKELGIVPPKPGQDIMLTIDKALTEKLYTTMNDWFMAHDLKAGAAIAIDPRSGAIRALVSYPSYDNNLFSGGIQTGEYATLIENPTKPLFNRAIAGEYPPGSTIKPVIASAALAERIVSPETMIESRGGISVGKFFFGDWKTHGFTDLRRAIAVSSDVYFYTLGGGYGGIAGLGMDRMKRYEERFGYGTKTGIDLPGEADGFLPDPDWKQAKIGERWYIGDDYHAAIGQGFVTATPLQIVNSIAAIANGGTLYVPHVRENATLLSRSVSVAPDILRVVREGMRETVTEGTAQSLQTLSVPVAGKTGTAQYGSEDKTHGWFVSFAPYENPELAVIVLVEGQSKDSTYHAVPITKSVYEWYFARENKP
ncbi:MAG: penicillin-binding protein 2 [Candidatus Moraniibacteriota bacterium]